jgi:hypothetical protein
MQSVANPSLDEFPLTGKNTGNFRNFGLGALAGNLSIAGCSGNLVAFSSNLAIPGTGNFLSCIRELLSLISVEIRYTEVGRPAQLLHNDTVSFKTRLQVRIPTTY